MNKGFKIGRFLPILAIVLLSFIAAPGAQAAVKLYPAPAGADLSAQFSVKVNGMPVSVYKGLRSNPILNYSFAYFDFSGPVTVEVTMTSKFTTTPIIRPTSKGINYIRNGNVISFTLSNPVNLSIEPSNGNIVDAPPLLLFANPMEIAPPTGSSSTVKYYGPGIHNTGQINLTSNQTLYIAGGAVVNGQVYASGNNIKIRGRGILDSKNWAFAAAGMLLRFDNVTNSSVEGIIAKDSATWTFRLLQSSNITVDNLKIISTKHDRETDGIDIVNSSFVNIKNSFIRSHDDAIAIKGFDTFPITTAPHTSLTDGRGLDTVNVSNTVLWTDGANLFRIGCESHAAYMRNLTFTNIDTLHYAGYGWIFTLQPAENMPIQNTRFENIRVETDYGFKGNFIELRPQVTMWSNPPEGNIDGVYFKNITLSGYKPATTMGNMLIQGSSSIHDVKNVTFENVTRYDGKAVTATSANVSISGSVSNIKFGAGGGTPIPDKTVPSVPLNLNGSAASSSQVNLTWSASTDNAGGSGVGGYNVYRNGVYVASVTGASASVTGLAANTSYNFTVASYDNASNNSAQGAIKTIKTLAGGTIPIPTGCPNRASANIYVAANDFSNVQGCNQWSYRDSKGANLAYDAASKQWKGSETYLLIWNTGAHPGLNADVVRRWTASATGSIRITGNAVDLGGAGSGADGVNVSIRKGTGVLWQSNLNNGSTTPVAYNVTTTVAAGNTIDFVVNKLASNNNDSTSFNPTITFTPGAVTGKPDLVVTALNYANGVFSATVKNQGTAATPAGLSPGILYSVDGTWKSWGFVTQPIAAGASVNIGAQGGSYVIPNGTHTIEAFVDNINQFAELNEANNKLAKGITVGSTALAPPTILSPANGVVVTNNLNKVTISWSAAAGATGYAVRMTDNQDGSIRDSRNSSGCAYVCIDSYTGTSITMNVRTGHTYSFWIHSRAGTGAYPGPSWSASKGVNFSYKFQ